MSTPNPSPTPSSTPTSAPIGAVLAAAAVAAIQAIVPLSNGVQPNYALILATGLVVGGATLVASLYHVQIPSPVQRAAITEVASLVETAVNAHTHAIAVTTAPLAPAPEVVTATTVAPVQAPA